MNFNLVEMYNGLLRFNKHILNELAEGLKHLPNLDGVSKGDSLIINEQDIDKAVRVLRLGGDAGHGFSAGSDGFSSYWVRSDSNANGGFFTTVKLD
ncbi:MAG: hypothetical protein [Bacteriophage sp.]|nr:MAG: hypothetical protein [Bacteriophage sp.]